MAHGLIPFPVKFIGKIAERVADGTITYASAVKILNILWDMGKERHGLQEKTV